MADNVYTARQPTSLYRYLSVNCYQNKINTMLKLIIIANFFIFFKNLLIIKVVLYTNFTKIIAQQVSYQYPNILSQATCKYLALWVLHIAIMPVRNTKLFASHGQNEKKITRIYHAYFCNAFLNLRYCRYIYIYKQVLHTPADATTKLILETIITWSLRH